MSTNNNRMNRDEALRKLLKLRQMSELGTEHESARAKELMAKIMAKYDLSENDITEVKEYHIQLKEHNIRWVAHIAAALSVKLIETTYADKSHRYHIKATPVQFTLFKNAMAGFENERKSALRKLRITLNSYLDGWVTATYPADESNVPGCPKCGAELSKNDGRWTCKEPGCGWKGPRKRVRKQDFSAYMDGVKSSGTLIAAHR